MMKLIIYKGFDDGFLSKIDFTPLIEGDVNSKLNVLKFDKKYKKRLNTMLTQMDDEDTRWISYEEFYLIKDYVFLAIKNDGLIVKCYINNFYPDCYPIPFEIENSVYLEVKSSEENENENELSECAQNILEIYSSIYKVDGEFYGSFYNCEYDKGSGIEMIPYYPIGAFQLEERKKAEIDIFINDDIESYLRAFKKIKESKPKTISIRGTENIISKRIINSIYAYCLHEKITILKYCDDLVPETKIDFDLIDIAQNDLKIPEFKSFRNINFYKNPNVNFDIVSISQSQIIKEIILQAEKAYDESNSHSFRDVFITASTGAGKSVMFQIPAVYLAKKYKKLTIIIEPVIALMEDQKDTLLSRGYTRVEAFNSNLISQVERENVLKKVKNGEIDLLYLSPETLLSYSLETIIGDREIGLIIVDEAHIVTTWGIGFRPDYWYLGGYINKIRNVIQYGKNAKRKVQHFPICAFTATAINGGEDDSVDETIVSLYMENPIKYIGYARRDDITFDISVKDNTKLSMFEYESKKANDLIEKVNGWIRRKEKTIVYFPYAKYANDAYNGFNSFSTQNFPKESIGLYTGRNTDGIQIDNFKLQKTETFNKFKNGIKTVMFATKAFGMGVDVNDIKNVYHYAVTGNLCDYVQEIGRAARKIGMHGIAGTDFYRNDISFMQRLFGMSQIRQYQVSKVLAGIYDVYKNKGQRSFLISPQSFTYIFASKGSNYSEDVAINKLKTCLLMLEKDFYDKYNFKVLISRPQSVFTKAFVCIDRNHEHEVLNSKYKDYLKFVYKGRFNKSIHGGNEFISDFGDIYSIDLKGIWEKYYQDLSFPQFKFYYFSTSYTKPEKVEIIPEIRPYVVPRQRVEVKVKEGLVLNDLKEKILGDFDYIVDALYSKFKKQYFTLDEFARSISSQYGMTKARIIANSIFDLVDPSHKVVKYKSDNNVSSSYMLANGTFKSYLTKSILKSFLIKDFANDMHDNYTQFMSLAPDSLDAVALKLLSIFDYISYEIIGGEEPEIFVRLNDPLKVRGIVTGAIKYSNNYVNTAKEKHERDVKVLYKFFCDLNDNKERWDYIEKYFLGFNVINESFSQVEGDIKLKKVIDVVHSYSTISLKGWKDAKVLFDESYWDIIDKLTTLSIPMPSFLQTSIKGKMISEDPIMSWPDKNIVVFGPDVTQLDIDKCKSVGWSVHKILELDIDKLLKELI